MKYRSRTDIINKILNAASGGQTKTKIMYGAFLSHAQLEEYLAFLLSKGLLEHDPMTGLYTQTSESLRFIHAYNEICELCEVSHDQNLPFGNIMDVRSPATHKGSPRQTPPKVPVDRGDLSNLR
jgi:predicted transcriptional regulator